MDNMIDFYGADNNIFTHLTVEEKVELYSQAKSLKNNCVCIEIGSYFGASSCFIAKALKGRSRLYCIDTWQNDNMICDGDDPEDNTIRPRDTFNEFLSNTRKYSKKIIPIRKWSVDAFADIKKTEKQIDFLFIDGDHNYDGVKTDWTLYSSLLVSGSIVAFHDTGWAEGVNKVIQEDIIHITQMIRLLPNLQIFRKL